MGPRGQRCARLNTQRELPISRQYHDPRDRVSGAIELPADLVSWVEEVGGGGVVDRLIRKPGGARKEAWHIDIRTTRRDGVPSASCATTAPIPARNLKDPWTLHREATVYLALQDSLRAGAARPRRAPGAPGHVVAADRGGELVLPASWTSPSGSRRPGIS